MEEAGVGREETVTPLVEWLVGQGRTEAAGTVAGIFSEHLDNKLKFLSAATSSVNSVHNNFHEGCLIESQYTPVTQPPYGMQVYTFNPQMNQFVPVSSTPMQVMHHNYGMPPHPHGPPQNTNYIAAHDAYPPTPGRSEQDSGMATPNLKMFREDQDRKEEVRQKMYEDIKSKVRPYNIKKGDTIHLERKTTQANLPYDPHLYTAEADQGTQIVCRRGEERKVRDSQKWKRVEICEYKRQGPAPRAFFV